MWQKQDKNNKSLKRLPLTSIVFFVCVYFYLWLVVEPRLIYQSFGVIGDAPVFSKGLSFLKGFLQYPGGLIDYLSAFLAQLYYYSWLGALIITVVAGGLYLVTKKLVVMAGGGKNLSFISSYIPALVLLVSYNNYYHPLTAALALLTALLFSVVHEKISARIDSPGLILTLFSLEFIILYYIAAGTGLLFVIIATAFELLARRRLILSGLFLGTAFIIVWFVGYQLFKLDIERSCLYFTPFYRMMRRLSAENPSIIINRHLIYLYLFIPLVLLSMLLWNGIARQKKPVRKDRRTDSCGELKKAKLKGLLYAVILVIAFLATVCLSFDGAKNNLYQTIYLTEHEMWPEVLEYVKNVSSDRYNLLSYSHCVNRALYHTGQLAENMFSYFQAPGSLLMPPGTHIGVAGLVDSSILIDLGHINLAEKRTTDSLLSIGDHPFLLQRLALINIVKRQTKTARVFLNVLAENLIYGKQARRLLRRLDEDPYLSDDRQISYLRSVMPTEDAVTYVLENHESLLLNLLESNRHNKMAFEYLMGEYLLTNQLEKFVQNLSRLDDFDYKQIPRHYEEAILIYSKLTHEEVDLHGRKISRETTERNIKFFNTLSSFMPDKKAAAYNALVKDFGNSYFFYVLFGVSGINK